MKLMLVSPIPPPIGGIASWTKNLLDYYSNKSGEWSIFHQDTAIKYRKITDLSLKSRLIGGIRDTKKIISDFKINIDTFHPDVIHLTSSASFALFKDILLLKIAQNKKVPVILHFRFGRIPELARKKNWEWIFIRMVVKKSKTVIVIDQKSFYTLKAFGYNNTVNIPNPISIEIEEKARKQLTSKLERTKGKAVFVGHVMEKKGVFELVRACISLRNITELTLIGPFEPIIKKELEIIAKERENGNWLKFTGSLNSIEIQYHLCIASLFVFPSYTEGFPNVVIDAMAMGCPIVATEVGAIPEILSINSENPCGICVAPKSVDQLTAAITCLLKQPDKAIQMGDHGREKVMIAYTLSNICKLYERTWSEALI